MTDAFLGSRVRVLTTVSYECALLPHFVGYYRSLGVNSFIISVHELIPGIREETARIAGALTADIRLVDASLRQRETGIEANNKEEIRQAHIAEDEWIIPADLDEFVQYSAPLEDLIREMQATDTTFVMGHFSDRISMDGALTPTLPAPSIWEQYPVQCNVSKMLAKCWSHKVVICRGDCVLASGHHDVISPRRQLQTQSAKVHHFKWRKGLPEALLRRVAIYERQGFPCSTESNRILDYLKIHERIVPAHFRPRPGWKPGDTEAKSRSVVYTAISEGYDSLNEIPSSLCPDQSIAFVEASSNHSKWMIEPLPSESVDSCRNAKMPKILPHRFIRNADYSLWIDGCVSIRYQGNLASLMEQWLGEHDLAVFHHRTRRCIYEEALACVRLKKDDPQVIFRQMERYSKEGYPRRAGLAECCVLLRRHTPAMEAFNEAWWEEICLGSKRDQLSFNYVARKLGFQYRVLPGTIAKNDFFVREPHLERVLSSSR